MLHDAMNANCWTHNAVTSYIGASSKRNLFGNMASFEEESDDLTPLSCQTQCLFEYHSMFDFYTSVMLCICVLGH